MIQNNGNGCYGNIRIQRAYLLYVGIQCVFSVPFISSKSKLRGRYDMSLFESIWCMGNFSYTIVNVQYNLPLWKVIINWQLVGKLTHE